MPTTVTTWYLELTDPQAVRPPTKPAQPVEIRQAEIPCPALNRFFYATVGAPWNWSDRAGWSDDDWRAYLDQPTIETWLGLVRGTPIGYVEIDRQQDEVELRYFGLLPQFVGQGLGGHFLAAAANEAWRTRPRRVWLHTCSLDGPAALSNYLARGFRVFREETAEVG